MKKYLKLIRIKHWLKNGLIFFPLVFGGCLFDANLFAKVCIGFFAFSLSASAIYIINDILDIENDRRHATKRNRPLASGAISVRSARLTCGLILVGVVALNFLVAADNLLMWSVLALYIVINFTYSMGLKNVALLDIFILVLGYILRIYYGGLIAGIEVSSWLYLTVVSMAFFLGLGKRRNEMKTQEVETRKVLKQYNTSFLEKNMYMCLGLTIAFYSLWCQSIVESRETPFILLTIPLVFTICMKYSLNVEGNSDGDPVEVVFSDKALLLLMGVYACMMFVILYVT